MRHEKLAARTTSLPFSLLGISLLAALFTCAAADEPTSLQVRILTLDSLVQPIGSSNKTIKVVVEDALGRPVPNAAVAFRLPEEGVTGAFANGLRTEVVLSGADGIAEAGPVVWGTAPGRSQVRVSAIKGAARGNGAFGIELLGAGQIHTAAAPAPERPIPTPTPVLSRFDSEREIPQYEAPSFWKRKWVVVALAAGGALAGGYAARTLQARPPGSAAVIAPPAQIDLGPVVIGPPLVSVGKP